MGNDIRDSTGTNEEHSLLKLLVYSTFISKLDKTHCLIIIVIIIIVNIMFINCNHYVIYYDDYYQL